VSKFFPQDLRRQSECIPCYRDDGPAASGLTSQKEGDTEDTLVSYQTHLRSRAILHGVEQRYDGIGGKVTMLDGFAGLVEDLSERKCYRLQMKQQIFQLGGRQRAQE